MQAIRPGTPLLFFDLAEIEELHNVHRVVAPAVRHRANPVLTCGDLGEWDSRRAGPWASRSVIYDADERLFKMWYSGYPTASGRAAIRPQRTGYAVSHDGIVWEKPALGLFDFDGDSGANNPSDVARRRTRASQWPRHPPAHQAVRAGTPAQPDLAAALSEDGARPG